MFPFIGSIKTSLLLAAAVGVLLVGLVGWGYWHWSTAQISTLNAKLAGVQSQAAALALANTTLRTDMARIAEAQAALNTALNTSRQQAATAAAAIRRQDLAGMARTDPQSLQRSVNAATAQMLQSLQDLSRAP